MNKKGNMDKKVIFDLEGTLADITQRRVLSTDAVTGKMNWDIFFDPKNIGLDQPNTPVITMAQLLHSQGYKIIIFSGRSKATKDSDVKEFWLDDIFPGLEINDIFAVFDDRQQVVDMWRSRGLTCFQVADGNF